MIRSVFFQARKVKSVELTEVSATPGGVTGRFPGVSVENSAKTHVEMLVQFTLLHLKIRRLGFLEGIIG